MNWFIFALIAPIFWALVNVIDKFLVSKIFSKWYFFGLWMGIIAIPISVAIFLFFNPLLIFPYSVISLFSGLMWGVFYFIYGKVLVDEEVSRATSLTFIAPLIVSILAGIFLKEVFTIPKYIGIILLVASGLLISHKKEKGRIFFIQSLKLILVMILIMSTTQVMDKFVSGKIGYWGLYFWNSIGIFLATAPFFIAKKIRTAFVNSLKQTWRKSLLNLGVAEVFAIIASLSYYIAVFLGPVSMVSALGSLQPSFVFVYIIFLSIFIPKFLKEEVNRYSILMKSVAIVFVILGTWLLV